MKKYKGCEKLKIVSHIVLSLASLGLEEHEKNYKMKFCEISAAAPFFELTNNGVSICGFQETSLASGRIKGDGYVMWSGGSAKGRLGCSIWISTVKLAGYSVNAETMVPAHAEPRFVLITFKINGNQICLVSANAPHLVQNAKGRKVCEKWWEDFSTVVRNVAGGGPVMCFIDANGRVGSVVSDMIGGWLGDEEDLNGPNLNDFCDELGLCIPSTFERIHCGNKHTWVHNVSGSLHRIDYVLIPEDWFGGGCRTWVDKSLDLNNSCVDHWALVAE